MALAWDAIHSGRVYHEEVHEDGFLRIQARVGIAESKIAAMARPTIFDRAMTVAERMLRYRKRLKKRILVMTPSERARHYLKPAIQKELTEFEKKSLEIREWVASRKDEIEKRQKQIELEEQLKALQREFDKEDPVKRMRKVREAVEAQEKWERENSADDGY
jgi:ATP-dependent Lon protease